MTFNFENLFKPLTEEEIEERKKAAYNRAFETPENLSYWFPNLKNSTTKSNSILKLPKTKVAVLDYEWWKWLQTDKYSEEKTKAFNDYLLSLLGDFQKGKTIFIKSGIFSDKFSFYRTKINDKDKLGLNFLDIFYTSMVFGASNTNEIVFREFIEDKEDRPTIYSGMPLHTEFRVFYDFDKKEMIGVANYWNPKVMREGLHEECDKKVYLAFENELVSDYDTHKYKVVTEVSKFLEGVSGLSGKWSIDIMKNKDDLWLIDLARMEKSALVDYIEKI